MECGIYENYRSDETGSENDKHDGNGGALAAVLRGINLRAVPTAVITAVIAIAVAVVALTVPTAVIHWHASRNAVRNAANETAVEKQHADKAYQAYNHQGVDGCVQARTAGER